MVKGVPMAISFVEMGRDDEWLNPLDLSHWSYTSRGGTGLGRAAPRFEGATRRVCCVQAPVGARVASPQSPILRWSKGSNPMTLPVPSSLRSYRELDLGIGDCRVELVSLRVSRDQTLLSQLGEGRA